MCFFPFRYVSVSSHGIEYKNICIKTALHYITDMLMSHGTCGNWDEAVSSLSKVYWLVHVLTLSMPEISYVIIGLCMSVLCIHLTFCLICRVCYISTFFHKIRNLTNCTMRHIHLQLPLICLCRSNWPLQVEDLVCQGFTLTLIPANCLLLQHESCLSWGQPSIYISFTWQVGEP